MVLHAQLPRPHQLQPGHPGHHVRRQVKELGGALQQSLAPPFGPHTITLSRYVYAETGANMRGYGRVLREKAASPLPSQSSGMGAYWIFSVMPWCHTPALRVMDRRWSSPKPMVSPSWRATPFSST